MSGLNVSSLYVYYIVISSTRGKPAHAMLHKCGSRSQVISYW